MEIVNKMFKSQNYNLYKDIVLKTLNTMNQGQLNITFPDGSKTKVGSNEKYKADIKIINNNFFKKCVLFGDIGFGESYVDGDWTSSNLTDLIKWMILNIENLSLLSGSSKKSSSLNLMQFINKGFHFLNRNSINGSKENIEYHYDLSNDFYKIWLDSTLAYSSAIFKSHSDTLEQAQLNKYQQLCDNLELKSTDKVLEIGSGWGGFACFAAKKYQCKITTITISKEQFKFVKEKIKQEGLENLIDLRYEDYRNITGKYDKIVSVEMLEAVGDKYLSEYFSKCDSLLKKNGLFTLQVITSPDSRYEQFTKSVDWIQKHIFPGSLLPSIYKINSTVNSTSDFHLIKFSDFGPMYAKTLSMWDENFNLNIDKIRKLNFDDKFIRKWKYYLNYCEAAFDMRNISVVQLTFTRPNNTEVSNLWQS